LHGFQQSLAVVKRKDFHLAIARASVHLKDFIQSLAFLRCPRLQLSES